MLVSVTRGDFPLKGCLYGTPLPWFTAVNQGTNFLAPIHDGISA